MASANALSTEDLEFLAKCEEELKDRFTDKDEEFMKVFNSESSVPPIVESWWVPNSGRRNERRPNRRNHPYERHGGEGAGGGGGGYRDRGNYDNRDRRNNYDNRRGYYNDRNYDDKRHSGYGHQSRY